MQVIRKTLIDVIAWDSEACFIIPRWQRHYVWGEKEVLQMWKDWCHDCAADTKHFCGVMLFRLMPEVSNTAWEIVDGQQRMTTFFLFFIALRDVCREKEIDFSELSGIFTLAGNNACRLVLQEGMNEDREMINALLVENLDLIESEALDKSALYAGYRTFRSRLAAMVPAEIPPFVLKVLQNLDLVVLTVDETDDTRHIFEVLNSRGKQVDPDELVSNLIAFLNSDDQELNEHAGRVWNFVSNLFDHDDLADFLDVFGKRNGQQSEKGTVYEEIKFELTAAREANRVGEWLREFEGAARLYNDILYPENAADSIRPMLQELQRLRVSKLNPLLLALLETFRDTPATRVLIHNLIAAVVRLLITWDRPNYRLEKFAEKGCYAFDEPNLAPEVRFEKIIRLVDEIWIDDATFEKAFATKNIYRPGANLSRLRYYLEKLETKLTAPEGASLEVHFDNEFTVEHIMPQVLDEQGYWRSALRTSDPIRLDAQHRAFVHTIGNLTVVLTKDYPAADTPYPQKLDFYLQPNEALARAGLRKRKTPIGNCALNRYFEQVPAWDFQTIATRSQVLARLAVEIWNKEDWIRETP